MELPWWAWAQAFVLLAPVVGAMIWWDWSSGRKTRKALDEDLAVLDEWTQGTVRCPACQGSGRVPKFEVREVV